MRKLVCGALALTAATAPGFASETDWLSLDSELEALSANLADGGAAEFGGYIVTSFRYLDDGDDAEENTANFAVNKARVHATKTWENGYSVKVQGDFAGDGGGFEIKDAYVRFPIGDMHGQIGNFKTPFLRSGLVSSSKQFFLGRTLNGGVWGERDTGIQLTGKFDKLDYTFAAMNSSNQAGADDDDGNANAGDTSFLYAARLGFQIGEKLNNWEGAYGYGDGTPTIYLAASYVDDDGSEDNNAAEDVDHNAFGFEAHAVTNVYSISIESVSYGDGGLRDYGGLSDADGSLADSAPLSLTATYMLTPKTWELGVRYDDYDDDFSTNKITVGANHYLNGHGLKWTYQYEMFSTDDDNPTQTEDNIFSIGLIASF